VLALVEIQRRVVSIKPIAKDDLIIVHCLRPRLQSAIKSHLETLDID
jgi:hypothetical protein